MCRDVSRLHEDAFIRFNDNGEFVDKSMKKDDIMFLFVRHVESVFSGDVVQAAEIALVSMCREVDSHYASVIKSNSTRGRPVMYMT